MPMYDHECAEGHITEKFVPFDDRVIDCETCGAPSKRIVSFGKSARTVDIMTPYLEENLGDKPVMVQSKQHLAQLCKERGIFSRRLQDGYKSYGDQRREI